MRCALLVFDIYPRIVHSHLYFAYASAFCICIWHLHLRLGPWCLVPGASVHGASALVGRAKPAPASSLVCICFLHLHIRCIAFGLCICFMHLQFALCLCISHLHLPLARVAGILPAPASSLLCIGLMHIHLRCIAFDLCICFMHLQCPLCLGISHLHLHLARVAGIFF